MSVPIAIRANNAKVVDNGSNLELKASKFQKYQKIC